MSRTARIEMHNVFKFSYKLYYIEKTKPRFLSQKMFLMFRLKPTTLSKQRCDGIFSSAYSSSSSLPTTSAMPKFQVCGSLAVNELTDATNQKCYQFQVNAACYLQSIPRHWIAVWIMHMSWLWREDVEELSQSLALCCSLIEMHLEFKLWLALQPSKSGKILSRQ